MQEEWVGKNVKLALLSESIKEFLEGKGFETSERRLADDYEISAVRESGPDSLRVILRIRGKPDSFVLELAPAEQSRMLKVLGPLAILFGGGSLFLRGIKSEEAFEELEEEFWLFVEETVARLAGSAKE